MQQADAQIRKNFLSQFVIHVQRGLEPGFRACACWFGGKFHFLLLRRRAFNHGIDHISLTAEL